jgi:hypothetical protein
MCIVGLVFGMFSPIIVAEHGKKECRIEAIKAQMPADDILKLCK